MILFKKLRALLHENRQAVLHAEATKENADRNLKHAQNRLAQAEDQAQRLSEMDRRNHYSESLTKSFRGRPAQ